MSDQLSPRAALFGYLPLLRTQRAAPLVLLAGLMLLAGLTEGIGILLLVPLLGLLVDSSGPVGTLSQSIEHALTSIGLTLSAEGLLLAFVGLVVLRAAIMLARDLLGQRIQYRIVDDLRHEAFAALLRAEWSAVHGDRSSDISSMLITDISRVGHALQVILQMLAGFAVMGAYTLVALGLSPAMTGIALLSGALLFLALGSHRRAALSLGEQLGESNRAVHGNVQQSLAGLKMAKILGNEHRQLAEFDKAVGDLRQRLLLFALNGGLTRAAFTVGGAILTAGYLYLGLRVLDVPVPELLTLVVIFARLMPRWSQVQQQLVQLLHAAPALAESRALQSRLQEAREPVLEDAAPAYPGNAKIRLDGLGYQYPDRDEPALLDISLELPPRTTTAMIGASGAGKSTLADLLMGLLVPGKGRLLVGERVIEGGDRMRWRRSVAYVPQETFLFADSVRQNLLLAKADASVEELEKALRRAAAEFVFELPRGLDTPVGERGVKLSGGERQRIALARALLRQPALLILDEATSALDIENEERIRQAIENLHGDLTVVAIGHRLSTLRHADQVLVLDQGRSLICAPWREAERFLADQGRDLLAPAGKR